MKTKTLIGILENKEENAFFLYFKDGHYTRVDNVKTADEAIAYYERWGAILEREYKLKQAIKKVNGYGQ